MRRSHSKAGSSGLKHVLGSGGRASFKSPEANKRNFDAGTKVHPKNHGAGNPMRGGIRL